MKVRSRRDFAAGAMYVGVGLAFAAVGLGYRMGSAVQMGPGYFPVWSGVLLMAVGCSVIIASLSATSPVTTLERWDWRGIGVILGAVLLFGVMVSSAGLVLSVFTMVLLSSFASREFKWSSALLNAVVLAAFSVLVFSYGLGLQLPVWPVFLGR